jgi:DNA-binding response OmpR family regulator
VSRGADRRPLVLIADDDEDTLALVSIRLEQAGYEVIGAADGKRAYELAVERRPDIAVLDVRMPLVFGYEVIRRIRDHDQISGMPVILLTASTDTPAMMRGFEVGADEYLTKPFNAQELASRVQALHTKRATVGHASES